MSANLSDSHVDVAVIGGGIHGVSMACEAASRGLKVVLLQGQDIASGASSATSTMLSGNLRKVEQFAWSQVRHNLAEQHLMLERAPHLVHPRHYTVIGDSAIRSDLRLKSLLWVYRHLQKERLKVLTDRRRPEAPQQRLKVPANPVYTYQDCSGLDYRLVIGTALQAKSWGADIYTRHKVTAAQRLSKHWLLTVQPQSGSAPFTITASCVINSCGWLANDLLNRVLKCPSRCQTKPVHAGHLIVRKPWRGDQGYVLQAPDKRFVYVTPLLGKYLLIGPSLAHERETRQEATESLLALYNRHFNDPLSSADILHERWARHAVFDDPSRDNNGNQLGEAILDLNYPYHSAPLLNVFGINLTMHRLLSERGLDILRPFTGKKANPALKKQKLPGGDNNMGSRGGLSMELRRAYPSLNEHLLSRLALTYGTLSYQILGERQSMQDLGQDFGHHLHEAEIRYLQDHEWAVSAEDILWRRTQLGIQFTTAEIDNLRQWLANRQ
jgi:glycerol-3-phosphate dehydrogenase